MKVSDTLFTNALCGMYNREPWWATTASNPTWRRIGQVRVNRDTRDVEVVFRSEKYNHWEAATGISCIRGDE